MSYLRYPAYKPSGVEWLGEVPEHWGVAMLRHLVECLDGKRIPLNSEERSSMQGDIPYWGANSIVGYVDRWIFDETLVLLGEDGAPFFDKAKPVSFLVCGKFWPNNHIHVLRPWQTIDARFLTYALNSVDYSDYIDGSTRDKLTQSRMNSILVPLPPLDEQRAIAAFLDRETAQIDALIAKLEQLIALLQEKRQALISHAVTKGLDPTVPMKDSGVEWLGSVPEHWEIRKLSQLFRARKGKHGQMLTKEYCSYNAGDYPVYSGQTEDNGVMGYWNEYEFDVGDEGVLFTTTVGSGKVMSLSQIFGRFSLSQNCMVIIPSDETLKVRFYYYHFTPLFDFERGRIPQHMQASFRMEDLYKYQIALPSSSEQLSIVEYLECESNKLDVLISNANLTIKHLTERRTALITAAVTGSIDMRA